MILGKRKQSGEVSDDEDDDGDNGDVLTTS